jgi:urease accessory protein
LSRATCAGAAVLVGLCPTSAAAHGALEGVGDFYAGLLHPLVVPSEALALVATGLMLGTSGLAACRPGLATLAAGLAAGLGLGRLVPEALTMPLLLTAALVAASLVTAGLRLPPVPAVAIAALAGAAVGMDARSEAEALPAILIASGASVIGGTALATLVAAAVLGRVHHWQRIAVRTAGSWITASAMLYFAWLLVPAVA